jgi:O-succinylbenzoate synthase
MKIVRIELHRVRLPLVRPFRTSSAYRTHIEHVLVRLFDESGAEGWGEIATAVDPFYNAETTDTAWHLAHDFIGPMVIGKSFDSPESFRSLYAKVKGNRFAKAGVEMAVWDLIGRSLGRSLADSLGGSRTQVEVGVSLGIEKDIATLLEQVEKFVAEGYRRVKLKIAPGWDLEPVRAVRERWPDIPLQVDANSAYRLCDATNLAKLDDYGLLLIEQPLADDDIIDHATLQNELKTPICLDESLHHADDVRKALDLKACRVVNIKVSRVGGLCETIKIHDLCRSRGIPVWCGGMHEFGLGRAANLAVASLPGFTLPGDTSGSDKYWRQDIIDPPIVVHDGLADVPSAPGLGVHLVMDRLMSQCVRSAVLTESRVTA